MTQKSWKIEEAFPRFVKAQAAKGVTDKTILTYNRHFHALSYHLDMTKTFDELTKDDLDSMLVSLRESGVSPNTISSYARVFRTFLKWCRGEGYRQPRKSGTSFVNADLKNPCLCAAVCCMHYNTNRITHLNIERYAI